MASSELSRRVEKIVGYPPLCDMDGSQRREFHEALLDADAFEDLPGKCRRRSLEAEADRPNLSVVTKKRSWGPYRGRADIARVCVSGRPALDGMLAVSHGTTEQVRSWCVLRTLGCPRASRDTDADDDGRACDSNPFPCRAPGGGGGGGEPRRPKCAQTIRASVIRVIGGDTIVVRALEVTKRRRYTVRLLGIAGASIGQLAVAGHADTEHELNSLKPSLA